MAQNVLIVDDSATMRKILMRGNRAAGIGNAAGEAADGVEGPRAAEACKFDLVLTDLGMPNRNGLELVTAVEDQPGTPPPISGPLRK